MKARRIRSALQICMVTTLVFSAFSSWAAQPATMTTGSTLPAQAVNRNSVVREILDAWGDYLIPVDAQNRSPYGPFDLRVALRHATTEQLLDARDAKTFGDVVAALPRTTGGGVVSTALEAGERIPLMLGDPTDNLVYTPVTPCRIIDTRNISAPILLNTGRQFFVTLTPPSTNYLTQGGVPTGCGIPPPPNKPSAVAINVTSVNSIGNGYLTVMPTSFGLASLVNYTSPTIIANAAIVMTYTGNGPEIFIYSGAGTTDVAVDIMGYFTPPAPTPLNSQVLETVATVPVTNFVIYSPACPVGFTLTGGGFKSDVYHYISYFASSAPDATTTPAFNGWVCQGTANTPVDVHCYAICARVPGQ